MDRVSARTRVTRADHRRRGTRDNKGRDSILAGVDSIVTATRGLRSGQRNRPKPRGDVARTRRKQSDPKSGA